MKHHQKGAIYLQFIRFVCRFPRIVENLHGFYQGIIINLPFLRASFKWKLIKKRTLHFEINKTLCRQGKPHEPNDLYLVEYEAGKALADKPQSAGFFTLDVLENGLVIRGTCRNSSIDSVSVFINGSLLRKISLRDEKDFSAKILSPILRLFTTSVELELKSGDGQIFTYQSSCCAVLRIPFGNGKLTSVLQEGFSLSKKGNMSVSLETVTERQNKYLELYTMVKEVFDRDIGTPLFLTYGTLLGFTRAGDFIPNDDDFDAGYVSLKKSPLEVKFETLNIIETLITQGFSVSVNPIGRLFKITKNTGVHLDLMPVWFEGEWNVAYRGNCVKVSPDDFLPAQKGLLRGVEVWSPRTPEKFLAGYYGENWRVPDPGYVSDFRQTGKNFVKNYSTYLLTPKEYFIFKNKINLKKQTNPGMGDFFATGLRDQL